MNAERLIRMGMRMLMRKGMNKGVQMASRKGKAPEDMTSEEREQAENAQQMANRARKGLRAARRFTR